MAFGLGALKKPSNHVLSDDCEMDRLLPPILPGCGTTAGDHWCTQIPRKTVAKVQRLYQAARSHARPASGLTDVDLQLGAASL